MWKPVTEDSSACFRDYDAVKRNQSKTCKREKWHCHTQESASWWNGKSSARNTRRKFAEAILEKLEEISQSQCNVMRRLGDIETKSWHCEWDQADRVEMYKAEEPTAVQGTTWYFELPKFQYVEKIVEVPKVVIVEKIVEQNIEVVRKHCDTKDNEDQAPKSEAAENTCAAEASTTVERRDCGADDDLCTAIDETSAKIQAELCKAQAIRTVRRDSADDDDNASYASPQAEEADDDEYQQTSNSQSDTDITMGEKVAELYDAVKQLHDKMSKYEEKEAQNTKDAENEEDMSGPSQGNTLLDTSGPAI